MQSVTSKDVTATSKRIHNVNKHESPILQKYIDHKPALSCKETFTYIEDKVLTIYINPKSKQTKAKLC